ncbi:rhodanese-like domain-containing protein [Bailinhaonella thermotolerans]|uniref:Rhodanese-like domain-containing protein n=2 Tax=Bailinhaonella thermotolerans TaxID=1070861 RepID=A0A3A4BTS2_9ACTN|nr:rhodanese-like domain-containing protein [Bailinhaonella thermotolerans]
MPTATTMPAATALPVAAVTPVPTVASAVLSVPAAANADAIAHFTGRLAYEADVSDVRADLVSGVPGVVVVDSRAQAGWDQGHLPGAIHLPTAQIAERARDLIDPDATVVTYCWGPGCNGATRAALEFARLGYRVKEMIGGYEYWVREGFPTETSSGLRTNPVDPLTAPADGISCAC